MCALDSPNKTHGEQDKQTHHHPHHHIEVRGQAAGPERTEDGGQSSDRAADPLAES